MDNTEVLNIRISEKLKESLSKQAQQQNQSLSDYVRDLLAMDVIQEKMTTISPDVTGVSMNADDNGLSPTHKPASGVGELITTTLRSKLQASKRRHTRNAYLGFGERMPGDWRIYSAQVMGKAEIQ